MTVAVQSRVITIDTYREAGEVLRLTQLRQGLYDEGAVLMRDVLVNLHGEEHRARRMLESRVFRRDFFRFYEQEGFPPTLARTLAPFLARGSADLVDFGYRVTLNLTADFTGIDRPRQTPEETEHLLGLLRSFGKAASLGTMTGDKESARLEIRAAMAEFDHAFHAPSTARRRDLIERFNRGELGEDDLPRDILTVLLRNEEKIDLSPDALLRETAFFLMAGALTSIHSMTHAMHEIFAWCEAHPGDRDRLDTDALFVQRCVHESMRLHPSSPTAGRRATCPMHLASGQDIEDDGRVVVDLIRANKDASVFGADAETFNPHRAVPAGEYPYGLSFGVGMHACLGRNLAAGVPARADTDAAQHHHGTVSLIVGALLAHDARPDPKNPPRWDVETGRPNWASYPILLGGR